jgi:hypothetical protein
VNFADVLLDADGAPVHHGLPAAGLILSLAGAARPEARRLRAT